MIAFQTNPITNKAISIPINIVSPFKLIKNPNLLTKFDSFDYILEVQKNLLIEEQHEYHNSLSSQSSLADVYNSSIFNVSMARILQKSLLPMYEFMQQKLEIDNLRLQQVLAENEELANKIREKERRKSNSLVLN
jgi:BRCC36 C-terminal helical domain